MPQDHSEKVSVVEQSGMWHFQLLRQWIQWRDLLYPEPLTDGSFRVRSAGSTLYDDDLIEHLLEVEAGICPEITGFPFR